MQNELKEGETRESMKWKDCNQDFVIGIVIEEGFGRNKKKVIKHDRSRN